jgi:hypothetical protein
LALRLWILGRSPLNSDEAFVALMAREVLRGHFFAFLWGQHYGGGEFYVVAGLFALFGQSRLVFGLAPVLLDAVAAVLVWRIGRRLFDGRVGALAAVMFWIWPADYLYLSTIEYGFRYLALVCGLAVVLFALRASSPRTSRVYDWSVLGFFCGLGWWCTPEITYFVLPALALIGYRVVRRGLRPPLPALVAGGAGALLGALPWLLVNLSHGFVSLKNPTPLTSSAWGQHVGVFFHYVLPMVLGLRLPGSGAWLDPGAAGLALYVGVAAVLVAWSVVLVRRRRARLLVAFVVLFPFLYGLPSYAWYWSDGRYALYLAPVLALLVASSLVAVGRRPKPYLRAAPLLGLTIALVATMAATVRLGPLVPLGPGGAARSSWAAWRPDPDLWQQPLIAALRRSDQRYVYTGYWISYTLDFEAHGLVLASDPGNCRYAPYLTRILQSADPAWVFPRPTCEKALDFADDSPPGLIGQGWTLRDFETYLDSEGVRYRTEDAGYFTIVYPSRSVSPTIVWRPPPA